jgi:hypothetical protein
MTRPSKWDRQLHKLARAEKDPGERVARRNREEQREADDQARDYRYLRRRRRS